MRSGEEFRHTIRRGARGAQPTLVTHFSRSASVPETDGPTSVGFVVSKAVGSAVDRNRVKRQLRHLMRDRVSAIPPGSRVVIRALAPSRDAGSQVLAVHLDASLRRAGAL